MSVARLTPARFGGAAGVAAGRVHLGAGGPGKASWEVARRFPLELAEASEGYTSEVRVRPASGVAAGEDGGEAHLARRIGGLDAPEPALAGDPRGVQRVAPERVAVPEVRPRPRPPARTAWTGFTRVRVMVRGTPARDAARAAEARPEVAPHDAGERERVRPVRAVSGVGPGGLLGKAWAAAVRAPVGPGGAAEQWQQAGRSQQPEDVSPSGTAHERLEIARQPGWRAVHGVSLPRARSEDSRSAGELGGTAPGISGRLRRLRAGRQAFPRLRVFPRRGARAEGRPPEGIPRRGRGGRAVPAGSPTGRRCARRSGGAAR